MVLYVLRKHKIASCWESFAQDFVQNTKVMSRGKNGIWEGWGEGFGFCLAAPTHVRARAWRVRLHLLELRPIRLLLEFTTLCEPRHGRDSI